MHKEKTMKTNNKKGDGMKIVSSNVLVKPCAQGDHFNAYIEFHWSNNEYSIIFCPTCFETKEVAEYEGKKAIPVMEAELNKQAALGTLQANMGKMIGETKPDHNPNLH